MSTDRLDLLGDDAVDLDGAGAADGPVGAGGAAGPSGAHPPAPGAGAPPGGPGLRERLARWPDAAPGWVRGPGALLLAAVLTAALVGGLVTHQSRARVAEQVAARTAVLSLSVGALEVQELYRNGGRSSTPDDGQGRLELAVNLVNRGEEPLGVDVVGLSTPEPLSTGDTEPVQLDAGATQVLVVPVQVDCADAAPVYGSGVVEMEDRPQEWLDAVVTRGEAGAVGAGAGQPARLPIVQMWGSLTDQLAFACETQGVQAVYAEPRELLADGSLVLTASNGSEQPMTLIPQDAPGVSLVSDPPFPVLVPPGQDVELTVGAAVDCVRAGSVLDLAHRVDLLVSADDGNPTVDDGGYPATDTTALAGWLAGRVTAACGVNPGPVLS